MRPERHPLWDKFAEFAEGEGISMKDESDWGAWWDMFLAGAKAQMESTNGDE